jgi:hypothetical protein
MKLRARTESFLTGSFVCLDGGQAQTCRSLSLGSYLRPRTVSPPYVRGRKRKEREFCPWSE